MLLPLLLQLAAPTATPDPRPPADWATLPELALPYREMRDPHVSDYVRDAVVQGPCAASAAARPADRSLAVELAVLLDADGDVRRIVPRAIDCPGVEQYAAGLVSRLVRGHVSAADAGGWYRTTIGFAWQ